MGQAVILGLLTLFASALGTATGFGTSTVMIPVMVLFVPLATALLFVGVGRYLLGGIRLEPELLTALLISIPVSFLGAYLAKRLLARIPRKAFRLFVAVFLALVGGRLLILG
jgi:uncharacterized protein